MKVLIFALLIITVQLSAADQVPASYVEKLPVEMKRKIIHGIALTTEKPSQYAALRNTKNTEERQQFYVKHLLIALHFWNTDLMDDIVAFEIGRFRKNPELIFSLNKDTWHEKLFSVQYIRRVAPRHTNAFVTAFITYLDQFTGQKYRLFLPQQNFSYTNPEFLVKKFDRYYVSLEHFKEQVSAKKLLGTKSILHALSEELRAQCIPYIQNESGMDQCSIFKGDQHTRYGEYYALNVDKKSIRTNSSSYWDLQSGQICLDIEDAVNNSGQIKVFEFHTLPHATSVAYDRFFIEALCGFVKDTRNYPYLWNRFFAEKQPFYKYPLLPLAPRLCNLLASTTFSDDQKKSLSCIINDSVTIPTMPYQFLRAINPFLVPFSFCTFTSLICFYLFPNIARNFSIIGGIIGCLWTRGNLRARKAGWESRMYACNDWDPRSIELLG